MSDQEYRQWVQHHASLFQLHSEADGAMFASWWPLVASYAVSEMVEASNFIATSSGGLWRTSHLKEIRQRITTRRRERSQAEANQQNPGFIDCAVCSGSGWAIVPHPRWVINGEWHCQGSHYPTAAVYCFCGRGQRLLRHAQDYANDSKERRGRTVGMDMTRYEGLNPGWHQQMLDRDNAAKDEARAKHLAAQAQERHGKLNAAEIRKRLESMFKAKT